MFSPPRKSWNDAPEVKSNQSLKNFEVEFFISKTVQDREKVSIKNFDVERLKNTAW